MFKPKWKVFVERDVPYRYIHANADQHRETYYAWRCFPNAMSSTAFLFAVIGFGLGILVRGVI